MQTHQEEREGGRHATRRREENQRVENIQRARGRIYNPPCPVLAGASTQNRVDQSIKPLPDDEVVAACCLFKPTYSDGKRKAKTLS